MINCYINKDLNRWEKFMANVFGERVIDEFLRPYLKENHEGHSQCWVIRKLLGSLKPRERTVLIMRFGLNGQEPKILSDIGDVIGVTQERIRQIEGRALRKLRHPSNANIMKEYLCSNQEVRVARARFELRDLLSKYYPYGIATDIARSIKKVYLRDAIRSLLKGQEEKGVILVLAKSCHVEVNKCLQCQSPTIPNWDFCSDECRKAYLNIPLVCDCGCGQIFFREQRKVIRLFSKVGNKHVFLNRAHLHKWRKDQAQKKSSIRSVNSYD